MYVYTSYSGCGLICGSLRVLCQLHVLLTLSAVWWFCPFKSFMMFIGSSFSTFFCTISLLLLAVNLGIPQVRALRSLSSLTIWTVSPGDLVNLSMFSHVQSDCSQETKVMSKREIGTKNSWELDHKEGWVWKIDAFELWYWRRLLRIPWAARRSS